jgi:hypothetical protein
MDDSVDEGPEDYTKEGDVKAVGFRLLYDYKLLINIRDVSYEFESRVRAVIINILARYSSNYYFRGYHRLRTVQALSYEY